MKTKESQVEQGLQRKQSKRIKETKKNNNMDKYIRFDWAVKRMLRDKANFEILEGFITVLLKEPVKILEILESEGNQANEFDKYNRADVKAVNSKGEIILVEVQQTYEYDFLQRLLFGVSKAITEHIHQGDRYDQVKKVYSISILYFEFGKGEDYLYHGMTTFEGVHTHDTLMLKPNERDSLEMFNPTNIFPEYYIIRVNKFNSIAETPMEEWLTYLSSGEIQEGTSAPGLKEAREKLLYVMMPLIEQHNYDRHRDNVMIMENAICDAKDDGFYEGKIAGIKAGMEEGRKKGWKKGHREGRAEGRAKGRVEGRAEGIAEGRVEGIAEGRAEGRAEGKIEGIRSVVANMKTLGMDMGTIIQVTGLNQEEIESI